MNTIRPIVIYTIGERTTEVFCLLSGHVRIFMQGRHSEQFAIHEIAPVFWIGDDSLTSDDKRGMEAQLIEGGDVLLLPRSAIFSVAEKYPIIYRNLYIEYARRTRASTQLLTDILFSSLRSRLAGRLLELAQDRGTETEEGILLDFQVNQNDLARMCMGSRGRVNKIMREWVEAGIIATCGDKYSIIKIDSLREEVLS